MCLSKEEVFRIRSGIESLENNLTLKPQSLSKLRVIVRSDIPKGYMISQAMHAAIDYVLTYNPQDWWLSSNTLVVLEVAGEAEILALEQKMLMEGLTYKMFREPAMGMQATSIALDPQDERAKALTKKLKLAHSSLT